MSAAPDAVEPVAVSAFAVVGTTPSPASWMRLSSRRASHIDSGTIHHDTAPPTVTKAKIANA